MDDSSTTPIARRKKDRIPNTEHQSCHEEEISMILKHDFEDAVGAVRGGVLVLVLLKLYPHIYSTATNKKSKSQTKVSSLGANLQE